MKLSYSSLHGRPLETFHPFVVEYVMKLIFARYSHIVVTEERVVRHKSKPSVKVMIVTIIMLIAYKAMVHTKIALVQRFSINSYYIVIYQSVRVWVFV